MLGYPLHPVAASVSEELNLTFYVHVMNSSLGSHTWLMPLILNSTNNSTIPNGKDSHEWFAVPLNCSDMWLEWHFGLMIPNLNFDIYGVFFPFSWSSHLPNTVFLKEVYGSVQISLNYCIEQLFSMCFSCWLSYSQHLISEYLGWLEKSSFFKKRFVYYYYVLMWVCVHHMYVGAFRGQRSLLISWNWSNRYCEVPIGDARTWTPRFRFLQVLCKNSIMFS